MSKPASSPTVVKTKKVVYTIRYEVDFADDPAITPILEKMQETGAAEVVDVKVQSKPLEP